MGIASAYGYLRETSRALCGLCRCCGKGIPSEEMNKPTPPQRPPLQYSDECWTAPIPKRPELTGIEKLRHLATERNVPTKVTLEDIEENIVCEYYFSPTDALHAEYAMRSTSNIHDIKTALSRMTFCVIVLRNGFAVTGESSCVNPETFNIEIGRKVARENAISKIWPLMGYELSSKLRG